jgi:hypothetical protein
MEKEREIKRGMGRKSFPKNSPDFLPKFSEMRGV